MMMDKFDAKTKAGLVFEVILSVIVVCMICFVALSVQVILTVVAVSFALMFIADEIFQRVGFEFRKKHIR